MPVQFCSGLSSKMEGKSKVCRNLFGSPNHEELRKDLDNQLKELNSNTNAHMKKTWSFDPDMDSGLLDGRYEWTLVKSEEYVPEVYRKPYRPTKFRSARKNLENTLKIDTPPSSPVCSAVLARLQGSMTAEEQLVEDIETLRRENETTPEQRIVSVRQTRIPDFMKTKKRRLEDQLSDEESSEPSAKSTKHH